MFGTYHAFCISRRILLTAVFCFVTCLTTWAQSHTVIHEVAAGETLYSIARKYNVSPDAIATANSIQDINVIPVGSKLKIPAAGQTPQRPAATKSTTSSGRLKEAVYDEVVTYVEYKTKKKDTVYSIAQKHGCTVDDLWEANKNVLTDPSKIKKGTMLRIPIKKRSTTPTRQGLHTVKLALVLPFAGSHVENVRSVEFYRGLLMGIETLKNAGLNAEVLAFNEPEPNASISTLTKEISAEKPDLVIGPVYPGHFGEISSIATRETKVLIPFSSKVTQVAWVPNLFVINASPEQEVALSVNMAQIALAPTHHFVFIQYGQANRTTFTETLKKNLIANKIPYSSIPASLSLDEIAAKTKAKKLLLIADSDKPETMKDMAAKAAALNAKKPGTAAMLGYSAWMEAAESTERQAMHKADAYIMTTDWFCKLTEASQKFMNDYKRWFNTNLLDSKPRMAPLGYDIALRVIGGMGDYGYDFGEQTPLPGTVAATTPLQSEIQFMKVGNGAGYMNKSLLFVHFKPDGNIVKVSLQK